MIIHLSLANSYGKTFSKRGEKDENWIFFNLFIYVFIFFAEGHSV